VKILLINQNATVEKLVKLSAQRIGLELLAATIAKDENADEYTWVLVDNESLEESSAADLRAKYQGSKIGLLYPKGSNRPDGFDLYIEKPFLPTELIDEFSSVINTPAPSEKSAAADDAVNAVNIDSTGLESLDGTDDLPPIENLDNLESVNLSAAEEKNEAVTQSPVENLESFNVADDLPQIDVLDHIDDVSRDTFSSGGDSESVGLSAAEEKNEAVTQSPVEDMEDFDLPVIEEPPQAAVEDLDGIDFTSDPIPVEEPVHTDGDLKKAVASERHSNAISGGFDEPKTSVLDSEEVKKVKDILSDDDISDFAPAEGETPTNDDLKIELGENSALLDEDDLADLRFDSLDEGSKGVPEDVDFHLNVVGDEKPKEETPIEDFDLSAINEESVADALGESMLKMSESAPVPEKAPPPIAGGELHNALSTISIETLREVLDGMHLTINISFSNKK
jgi:uncharacterized membrane protein